MNKNQIACLLILLLGSISLNGQEIIFSERQAEIHYQLGDQGTQFSATTPPLRQIAGAPPAFYTYFWEFGDGQFSFEESPLHIYPHAGEFEARLFLTNNYDDGKPPPTRPKKLYINKSLLASSGNNIDPPATVLYDRSLNIQTNHDPSPDEELVCIFSYKNQDIQSRSGRLYLFYNERKFRQTHFEFGASRTYHGEIRLDEAELFSYQLSQQSKEHELWASVESNLETEVLSGAAWLRTSGNDGLEEFLNDARSIYRDQVAWRFGVLEPQEERNLFVSFFTTEEMLADTNAIISMQGIYVPEGGADIEVFTLEMPVVNSHDPNHIAVSDTRVNFRRAKRNELTYNVRFQNTGEGPASEIRIETTVPRGLNSQSLNLLEYYPYCPVCPEGPVSYSCLDTLVGEGQITFSFKNIYLPGIRQSGVSSRDSTRGYVKFSLSPEKNVRRVSMNSRADIFFDKNPPIRTNTAVTHFTGLAPGFKAGVDVLRAGPSLSSYFIGVTISPVKASKWYYQGEIMLGYGTSSEMSSSCFEEEVLSSDDVPLFLFGHQETLQKRKTLLLDVVPLQFRKNLLDLLSIGLGTQLSLILDRRQELKTTTSPELFEDPECQFPAFLRTPPLSPLSSSAQLPREGAIQFFIDLNAGMVKNGPVGGLRYLYSLNPNFSDRLQLYANWKF